MKQSLFTRLAATLLAIFFLQTASFAQTVLTKALNGSFYYYVNPGVDFTWSGSSTLNYCHGYGTLKFYKNDKYIGKYTGNVSYGKNEGYGELYYPDGSTFYKGYWKNDQKNGYGRMYDENGYLTHQGNFENDKFVYATYWEGVAKELANCTINKVFDGGTNGRYTLLRSVTDSENNLTEIHVRITFNGNLVETNSYSCTLVISTSDPYIEFINCNQIAKDYIDLMVTEDDLLSLANIFLAKR